MMLDEKGVFASPNDLLLCCVFTQRTPKFLDVYSFHSLLVFYYFKLLSVFSVTILSFSLIYN